MNKTIERLRYGVAGFWHRLRGEHDNSTPPPVNGFSPPRPPRRRIGPAGPAFTPSHAERKALRRNQRLARRINRKRAA